MTGKKTNTTLAGILIVLAKFCFLFGIISLVQFSLGTNELTFRPVILLILGSILGAVGFYLVGSSKIAWLQLPHQALAFVGVGTTVYGGIELYNGNGNVMLWVWFLLGPFFFFSWRYCAKHNFYKA
ncbi:hypothetical protein QWY77_11735 [Thalassotalea ponticola]|uniref:hypothetical protein n=1 Tax=Thalassotalea ponticola TaxID=1523392 RepID=UPI0025B45A6C|nr:hypothetical protein [Thalassotalea ponticola]MDN3653413.1 hypothetical protein [Thalassotalea ponticola]